MKRMLKRMLALALCLCAMLTTAVGDTIVVEDQDIAYQNIGGAAVVGDAVYLLETERNDAALLKWQDGMDRAMRIAGGLIAAGTYNSQDDLEELKRDAGEQVDTAYAISCIFSDGEQLYAFNHLNGLVFTVQEAEGGLSFEDVIALDNASVLQSDGRQPVDVIKAGKWMLWHAVDSGSRNYGTRVLAVNLETGAVKQAVLPEIQCVSAYKDGKLLVLGTKNADNVICTYDPETDEVITLGALPGDVTPRKIAYSAEMDMLVYQDKTRIMGWTAEGGAVQVGFIPTTMAFNSVLICGDKLLYSTTDNDGITAAVLTKDYAPERSLNILGGTMNSVVSRFSKTWNGIPFYYTEVPEDMSLEDYLMSDDGPDLFKLSLQKVEYTKHDVQKDDYIRLLECGYLMDISAYEEIKAYADVLYPAYKELVTRDGGVYAMPVNAESYRGWFINKEVMNALGLTAEDVPTSLTELCAFATTWNNEFAEKYPHFTLLNNTENYRERLLEVMLEEWSEYCQFNGKALNYDDPIFREMLTALDAAELDKLDAALKQTNPEVSEYKQALIWTGCKDVGNFASYMEEYSDRIFIPLTLTPDTPYVAAVETVEVWAVNARSANAEYAAAMLIEMIGTLEGTGSYVLRTNMTEPVVSQYYADNLAYAQERLAALQARVEESVNKETILRQIEEQQAYIDNELKRTEYSITPSAIEHYVQVIAPASYIHMPDAVTGNSRSAEISGCISRYLAKTLSAEDFITQMNKHLQAE